MAVNANTIETYDAGGLLKRDLSEQYEIMSPEETPFQQLAGTLLLAAAALSGGLGGGG